MRLSTLIKQAIFFMSVSYFAHASTVDVVVSKAETKNRFLSFSGTIIAENDTRLTSLEPGIIKQIHVDAGDHVKKGQVLLTLDKSLASIRLLQAQAALTSAEVRHTENVRLYDEILDLAKNQVIAKTVLSERKANAANSKALLAQAQANVKLQSEIADRHTLRAPFSGYIATRNIDVGEWVNSQSQVFQLVSDDKLRIFIDIPQEYFADIQSNQDIKVEVSADTASKTAVQLPLSQIVSVINPSARTFQARIDLPSNTAFISGMSSTVKLAIPNLHSAQVTLPKSALKRHPDGNYSVLTLNNKTVKLYGVTLLKTEFDQVTVQGVPNNVEVIVSGGELLTAGDTVTTVNRKGD